MRLVRVLEVGTKSRAKWKAYKIERLWTIPIDPDASAREEPVGDRRTRLLVIVGLRGMEEADEARTEPTPIATPAKLIDGILDAGYLNPSRIRSVSRITRELKNARLD